MKAKKNVFSEIRLNAFAKNKSKLSISPTPKIVL